MSLSGAKRSGSGSTEVGARGRRLRSCEPCGEGASRGKENYSTADRENLGGSTPQGSVDRRAVDIGGARTPARAQSSSDHKVGRSRCRLREAIEEASTLNIGIDVSKS